jgi:hypothetical protein
MNNVNTQKIIEALTSRYDMYHRNKYIFFIFGVLLKIIDDYEDGLVDYISHDMCLVLKCLFIVTTIIAFIIDTEFINEYVYIVISMAFIENSLVNANGEILKFYILHGIITLAFYIYYVCRRKLQLIEYSYVYGFSYTIVKIMNIYTWLYLENELFGENISEIKIFYRTYLVVSTVLFQSYIISNLKNMTIAYMTISVLNMIISNDK